MTVVATHPKEKVGQSVVDASGNWLRREDTRDLYKGAAYDGVWRARGKCNIGNGSQDYLHIGSVSAHFGAHFGELIERNVPAETLEMFLLEKDMNDLSVFRAYGENNAQYPRKVRIHFAHFYGYMQLLQKEGVSGRFFGYSNDKDGVLRHVSVHLRGRAPCSLHSRDVNTRLITNLLEGEHFVAKRR